LDELRQDDVSFILETSEAVTWDVTVSHDEWNGSFVVTAVMGVMAVEPTVDQ